MTKVEKAPEENPYILSTEERTCPNDVSTKEKAAWLDERIDLQNEGIEHGIRPQLLFRLPPALSRRWRSKVWKPYIRTKSLREQAIIRRQVGPKKL